jgi:hypothetical protein
MKIESPTIEQVTKIITQVFQKLTPAGIQEIYLDSPYAYASVKGIGDPIIAIRVELRLSGFFDGLYIYWKKQNDKAENAMAWKPPPEDQRHWFSEISITDVGETIFELRGLPTLKVKDREEATLLKMTYQKVRQT